MSWPSFLQHAKAKADAFRERVFLSDLGSKTRYTYGQFDGLTDRMAGSLMAAGLAAGDRVALLYPNHSDFVLAYFAIIKAGAVAVPVNPLYTLREVSQILSDCGACWVIGAQMFAPLLEQVRASAQGLQRVVVVGKREGLARALQRECGGLKPCVCREGGPDDLAFIFYTSGTTGSPKGVMLTHRNVIFGGGSTAQSYGLRETDVALACLPLVHIFANASPVLGAFNSGGRVVVMERFHSEGVLQVLEQEGVTWFPGVPTMFGYLLNAFEERPRVIPSFRMGLSGGASLSTEHLARFESRFGVPVLEVYGLTESTGLVTANPVYGVRKAGSVGVSVSGVAARLVDDRGQDVSPGEVGELVFRGPNATPGYWARQETTRSVIRDGWVHTGDLARQDEDGYHFIVGRKDEMIISGGYNIYPREIEEVLYLHDAIAEAAVIGVRDSDLGQVAKAFVVFKAGRSASRDAITDFCRERLAPYKIPRRVEIMAELPKNPTGKILKKGLPRD